MIEVLYGIQYHSQLRRTRPEVVATMEKTIAHAIRGGGGTLQLELSVGIAQFHEDGIAFWLELVSVLEQIYLAFAKAGPELFGYACLVRRPPLQDDNRSRLIKAVAREENPSGVWVSSLLSESLSSYAAFGPGGDLLPLTLFRNPNVDEAPGSGFERKKLRENLLRLLSPSGDSSAAGTIALVGPQWSGKRQVLRTVLDELLGDFPPCRISFRSEDAGLYPIAAAFESLVGWKTEGHAPSAVNLSSANEPETALTSFFEEARINRLSSSYSPSQFSDFQSIATVLASRYRDSARGRSLGAFFVLENVHLASAEAIEVVVHALGPLLESRSAVVLLTGTDTEILTPWKGFQPKIARIDGAKASPLSRHLSTDLLEVAYALYLLRPVFSVRETFTILRSNGLGELSLSRAISSLVVQGFLVSVDDPEVAIPDFGLRSRELLGERAQVIQALVQKEILLASSRRELRPSLALLKVLSSLGGEPGDELSLSSIEEDIDAGLCPVLLSAIADGSFSAIVGDSRAETLALIVKARSLILEDRPAHERLLSFINTIDRQVLPDDVPARYRAALVLCRAALYYMDGNLPQCASLTKEALVLLQGEGQTRGISRAYRFMALIELSRDRVNEALDYLSFAMESAEKAHEEAEYLIAEVWSSIAFFLWGNYAKAVRLVESASARSLKVHSVAWAHWTRFFLARLRFETGNYGEALTLLSGGSFSDSNLATASPDERSLIAAWRYRAQLFLGEASAFVPSRSGDEALFGVEAAYLAHNYSLTHSLAGELLAVSVLSHFSSPDLPSWSSGFALIEDRIQCGTEIRGKILRSYRALALSNLGARAEAVEHLRALIKDEKLSDLDPNDAFYFWAYSATLSSSEASNLDRGTVLSLAFKRLQRRASRIDDPVLRQDFLSLPRWNAALFEDAKRQNLI